MKKILYLLTFVLLLGSCEKKEDYSKDEKVDARVKRVIEEYRAELLAQPNGWNMVVVTKAAGAFNMWVKFDDNNQVEMISDFFEAHLELQTTVSKSSYTVKALQRPTLSFDTYNVIHLMCDPSKEVNGSGRDGTGLSSDFEFEFDRYVDGKFTLKGRFNNCDAYLTPATAQNEQDARAGKLMENSKAVAEYFKAKEHQFAALTLKDQSPVSLRMHNRLLEVTYIKKGAQPGEKGAMLFAYVDAYVDYDKNIIVPTPVKINGYLINKFVYDPQTNSYNDAIVDNVSTKFETSLKLGIPLKYLLGDRVNKYYSYSSVQIVIADGYNYPDDQFKPYPQSSTGFKGICSQLSTYITKLKTTTKVPDALNKTHLLRSVDLVFTSTESGEPAIDIWIDVRINPYATLNHIVYKIGYNADESFKFVGEPTFFSTSGSSSTNVYVELAEFKLLTDFFTSHTFKLDWESTTDIGDYADNRLVRLVCVDDPDLFVIGEVLPEAGNI